MEKHSLKNPKDGTITKGSLDKLVSKYTKKDPRGKLNAQQAEAMFTAMLLRVEPFELELLCDEFDPTGRGEYVDLDLLAGQFEEWAEEKQAKEFDEKTGGKYDDDKNKPYPESDSSDDDEKKRAQNERALEEVMGRIAKDYFNQNVDIS
jgi:hypothetical protein